MTTLYEPAPGWDAPPAGECRPGTLAIRDYLVETYGADNLGCYGDRPKTGGGSPSLHRDGRAVDIGFASLGAAKREEVFEWLAANAGPLGLQMVLCYVWGSLGGRRWRLPYFVGDRAAGFGSWRKAGHWLHIETTNAGADDARSVAERLGGAPVPTPPPAPPAPTPAPPSNDSEVVTVNVSLPKLSRKSPKGSSAVKQLQALISLKDPNRTLVVDGHFGPKTEEAVRAWQGFFGLEVDGWVGPATWKLVLEL